MKLFFCLALFSLSSAEPLFRLSPQRNKSVRHHLDQIGIPVEAIQRNRKSDDSASFQKPLSTYSDADDVYKRDNKIGFSMSGNCKTSQAGGGFDVNNPGDGKCYITYGDCSGSTLNDPGITNSNGRFWINDIHNEGSGIIHITYCSASSSNEPSIGKELINTIYNAGSGKIYIKYVCGASGSSNGRKMMNNLFNAGSAEIYMEYKNCCPTFSDVPSFASNCAKMFNNIRAEGSGVVDLKYWDCGGSLSSVPRKASNCGILGRGIHNAGSGFIYITYWNCGALLSSGPSYSYSGQLVDNVDDVSSGGVDIKYGRCSTSTSSARSDTNVGAKLNKMLTNVPMSQGTLELNSENGGPRLPTLKRTKEGNNEKKDAAAEADPSC